MDYGALRKRQFEERARFFEEVAKRHDTTDDAGEATGMTRNNFMSHLSRYTGKTFNEIKGRAPRRRA